MLAAFRAYSSMIREPFVSDVIALLNMTPGAWYITGGYRSWADQQADWEKGRDAWGDVVDASQVVTNAKPGESAHEYGLAVDVTLVVAGQDCWDFEHPLWQGLIAAVDAHPRLHSGYHFPTKDYPHIEAADWKVAAGI